MSVCEKLHRREQACLVIPWHGSGKLCLQIRKKKEKKLMKHRLGSEPTGWVWPSFQLFVRAEHLKKTFCVINFFLGLNGKGYGGHGKQNGSFYDMQGKKNKFFVCQCWVNL